MSNYKHILLAADLHPQDDDPVAEKAIKLARDTGATLSVVHVVEFIYNYGGAGNNLGIIEWQEEMKKAAQAELATLGEKLGIPAERQHVLVGSPKDHILQEAKQLDVDLIVVGNRRQSGLTSLLLGSTASGILHNAKCDVFAVNVTHVPAAV